MLKLSSSTLIFIALLCGASTAAYAQSALDTFQRYVSAGDEQNIAQLEETLHGDFASTFVFKGKDEVKTISRQALLDGFESGKFGGKPRQVSVLSDTPSKNMHVLAAKLSGEELVFDGVFVLQRINSQWVLTDEYLIVEPAS